MASTMTRRGPLGEFADLRARIERLFDELGDGHSGAWSPAIDVIREDDKIVVRADVPGVKPEDIVVEFDDGILTVSGSLEEETEKKEKDYVRRERRAGTFARSMTLPSGVSPDDIEAHCRDGVLEVTITAPMHEKRTVTIKPTA